MILDDEQGEERVDVGRTPKSSAIQDRQKQETRPRPRSTVWRT